MGILGPKWKKEAPPGCPGGVRWNYDGPITYNPSKGLYEDRSGETSFADLRQRFQPESAPTVFEKLSQNASGFARMLGLKAAPADTPESSKRPGFDL